MLTSIFIFPIWQQLSKTTKNLQSLWSIIPKNSRMWTRNIHISLYHQHQSMLLIGKLMWIITPGNWNKIHRRTTNMRKRNRLQVVTPIELLFLIFLLKQTQTKQIVCFVLLKFLESRDLIQAVFRNYVDLCRITTAIVSIWQVS